MSRESVRFGGEFIVSESGIYTNAHWYHHPKNGHGVILVGTNHMGDRACYEYIQTILGSADFVLYEGGPRFDSKESDKLHKEIKKQAAIDADRILAGEPQIDLYLAQRAFFVAVDDYFKLPGEGDVFDRSQAHWEQGDSDFFDRLRRNPTLEQKLLGELQEALAKLDKNDTQPILELIRSALQKIKDSTFTRKDFGSAMAGMWSNSRITTPFSSAFALPRDQAVIAKLERIFSKQKQVLHQVGIVFGAAHIANLRHLLEKQGYVKERTEKLCSMQF